MPDREQIQDLIVRAKAWTGETPLDADTFSLMWQMWTMLGELMPPTEAEPVDTDRIRREAQNEILAALEEFRNSRRSPSTIAVATDALRVARAIQAQLPDEPAHSICVHCGEPIQEASKRNGFVHGWRHLNGMLDFRQDMGGHDARPADWTDPGQGPKKPLKLSKLVKQAASEQMGGYPDESLLRLYRVLKDEGL